MTRLSLILATYDAASTLPGCLASIFAQRFEDFELLVQDGGSRDGTWAIAASVKDPRLRPAQAPDRGIYDAWNKALDRARGEWIAFLGADDRWADDGVLERRFAALSAQPAELLHSRIRLVNDQGVAVGATGRPWDWAAMRRWQGVAHIGMFHHRSLFERFGRFDPAFRIAGDYDFLLRLGPGVSTLFMDEIQVNAGAGGISRRQIGRALAETRAVQSRHPEIGPARAWWNFGLAWAKAAVR